MRDETLDNTVVKATVRKIIKRWKCYEYGDDLEQEGFLIVQTAGDMEQARLADHLFKRLMNHMRKRQRKWGDPLSLDAPLPENIAEDDGFEEHLINQQPRPDQQVECEMVLEECKRLVGEDCWEMICMSHEGYNQTEIGDKFGIDRRRVSELIISGIGLLQAQREVGAI